MWTRNSTRFIRYLHTTRLLNNLLCAILQESVHNMYHNKSYCVQEAAETNTTAKLSLKE